jgi:DNA replication protein DnaC
MNPMPELAPLLKQWRLSGRLDSLEHRNRQAIEQQLAYTDFLAVLVQDEVARREQKKRPLRLRRANFRSPKTLEPLDFDFNPGVNQALIHDLATGRFIRDKVAVLIAGPGGTGQSPLAQALGHCALQQGYEVLFTTQSQLLGSLQAARATGSYEHRFQTLARVALLIMDDFGLKPWRSPQDEDFHDLMAERYEQAATLITSNLEFREWSDAFPNARLCKALLDRLTDRAHIIETGTDSYRCKRTLASRKPTLERQAHRPQQDT